MIRLLVLSSGLMLVGDTDVDLRPQEMDARRGLCVLQHPATYQVHPVPAQNPVTQQLSLASTGILHFLGVDSIAIWWGEVVGLSQASGVILDLYERALKRYRNDPNMLHHAS